MRGTNMIHCSAAMLALMLLSPALVLAQQEQKVYVLDAIDGDSLQLQRDGGALVRVHLIGVEAPGTREEKRHPSKLHLGSIAFGRWGTAQCDPVPKPPVDAKKKPPPKPLLCRVRVDGKDVGLAQLEAGQASFSARYAGSLSEADRMAYKGAERSAKDTKKGMWAD
jgi:endonuclease YncB( thermonuclease family)